MSGAIDETKRAWLLARANPPGTRTPIAAYHGRRSLAANARILQAPKMSDECRWRLRSPRWNARQALLSLERRACPSPTQGASMARRAPRDDLSQVRYTARATEQRRRAGIAPPHPTAGKPHPSAGHHRAPTLGRESQTNRSCQAGPIVDGSPPSATPT